MLRLCFRIIIIIIMAYTWLETNAKPKPCSRLQTAQLFLLAPVDRCLARRGWDAIYWIGTGTNKLDDGIYAYCLNHYTVNSLHNVGVGPQWFMMLKWICRCNDFLLFRPWDEKTQNKCAAISTWFAMSESLISNLDKSTETRCQTIFPNQGFR